MGQLIECGFSEQTRNIPESLSVTTVCYFGFLLSPNSGTVRIPYGFASFAKVEGRNEEEEGIKERHSEI
jgi:hypothetical protein